MLKAPEREYSVSPFGPAIWKAPRPLMARSIRIAGIGQRTLDVHLAHRRGAHAQTEISAFRHAVVAATDRHALQPVDLIEKVGEFRAARLNDVVLMFAMLCAITSTFVCCAFIPVAAIASALYCHLKSLSG